MKVTLSMLEYVDCDHCGAVGKYRRLGPNHFACKECGAESWAEPCPPSCPERHHGPDPTLGVVLDDPQHNKGHRAPFDASALDKVKVSPGPDSKEAKLRSANFRRSGAASPTTRRNASRRRPSGST